LFDIANCVKVGNIGTNCIATYSHSTSTSLVNYFQILKQHSQNSNYQSLFRVYQSNAITNGLMPRYLSANATNQQPSVPVSASNYWHDSTDTRAIHTSANLSDYEFQFFSSDHWFIWSAIDVSGRGGTAGIFDVEATGQEAWAKNLNSLYSPQFYMSAHGDKWPAAAILRQTETIAQSTQVATYSNLMYNGDAGFTNRGAVHRGVHDYARAAIPLPQLHPDVNQSIFPTRDEIGDTQNYMMPVYFHVWPHQSISTPENRALLNGRVPFLWRTSDNAGQTGQKATVGGVEYRFVRLHSCGSTSTAGSNAATYMVPTSIGGL
jgi:hypothetical protein